MVVVSPDGGATWEHREPIPDFTGSGFGYGYATAAACSDSRILAVGYWLAALSTDGIGWTAVDMEEYGYPAQVAAAAVAPWGTWIAAGYYLFAARSEDGTSFVRVNLPGSSEWVLDVVALSRRGYWVLVGDRGNIWRSTDDGFHFSLVHQGGPDLYAVGADGMGNVLAVGWGGTAYLSQDFGETWRHCPSGRTGFLGDVAWLPDGKALVVGQDGPFVFDPTSCP